MMRTQKDQVYISVPSPIDSRKNLLLATIDTINLLERYEYLKQIHDRKRKAILGIKTLLNEINNDLELVKDKFSYAEKKEIKKEKVELKEKHERTHPETKKSETYKYLAKELKDIQDKLNKLEI
ncbi:MAG: hypothetical protein AABX55_03210 [Nanoarchaeota archaeon]